MVARGLSYPLYVCPQPRCSSMVQYGVPYNLGAWINGLGDACCRRHGLLPHMFFIFLKTRGSRCFGVASRVACRRRNVNANELICARYVLVTVVIGFQFGLWGCRCGFRRVFSLSGTGVFCLVTCETRLHLLTHEGHSFYGSSLCPCAWKLIHVLLIFVQPMVNLVNSGGSCALLDVSLHQEP